MGHCQNGAYFLWILRLASSTQFHHLLRNFSLYTYHWSPLVTTTKVPSTFFYGNPQTEN